MLIISKAFTLSCPGYPCVVYHGNLRLQSKKTIGKMDNSCSIAILNAPLLNGFKRIVSSNYSRSGNTQIPYPFLINEKAFL